MGPGDEAEVGCQARRVAGERRWLERSQRFPDSNGTCLTPSFPANAGIQCASPSRRQWMTSIRCSKALPA